MRMLHTSDWHIGRTLHKVPQLDAQRAALAHIAEVAAAEQVDLVVVAGDVFDHAVPSAEALEILEQALRALVRTCPVVVTAGNHDSLRRLGYGSTLFTEGLHLCTRVDDAGQALVVGDTRIYPIPYLHPETARVDLAAGSEEPLAATHSAVMGAVMDRVRADLAEHPRARSVVVAHAWVAGCATSDSERDVSIGGLGTITSDVFAGVDYVALGHLHCPQEPKGPPGTRVRYSGSPLRYSFSEATHTKTVSIVEFGDDEVRVREIPIPQPRDMAVLRGLLDELLDPTMYSGDEQNWVSAIVTDDRRPSQMWQRLQARFPHLLQVRHEPASGFVADRPAVVAAEQKPLEVAADFVEYVTNGPISAEDSAAFDAAVQVVRGREQT